jgi:Polyketide cyclase / dehydrase and lipid transport
VGAVHTRLARDFVVDTRLEGGSRVVTFANGEVVRERIVDIDDRTRRLAYAVVEWRTSHHNASFQVIPDGDRRCRVVWITDLLPDTIAELVEGFMEQGVRRSNGHLKRSTRQGRRQADEGSRHF